MPTPKFRVQVNLERDGGLPKDDSLNVWHFEGDSEVGETDRARWDSLVAGLVNRVRTFYQAISPVQLASTLSGNGTIRVYDMDDPKPRIPRNITPFTMNLGGSALPAEVALCLSFRGAPLPGGIPARRRGRVYLGPLSPNITDPPSGGDVRPGVSNRDTILAAAKIMATGVDGAARLAIYSPTSDLNPPFTDEAFVDVAVMYLDDAFDTQRRRGAAATSRIQTTI